MSRRYGSDGDDDESLIVKSFRISEITFNRLSKIARDKKTNYSSILRRISNRYASFGVVAERRREYSMPRSIVDVLFSALDESKMKKVEEIYYDIALSDIRARYTSIDCETIKSALRSWARFNDLNFRIETDPDDKTIFWVLCQHAFHDNWAIIMRNAITRLLKFSKNCEIEELHSETDMGILRIQYRISEHAVHP